MSVCATVGGMRTLCYPRVLQTNMATSAWCTRAGDLSPSDDETTSDEDVVVVFDSSSEADSDGVFAGSDSEEEESSDDKMASAREWYRIDPDSIPARPPRFEFKGSPGVTITVSLNHLSFLRLTLMMN